MSEYKKSITATEADIDELGHVNNAVWVQWIQDVAVSHWYAIAPQDYADRYIWVVTRHEIDYRGNVSEGQTVTAETWVPDPPRGARFDRMMKFTGEGGKVMVESRSTWALIERANSRLMRVPREMAELFLA